MITIDRGLFFSNLRITQNYCEQQLKKGEEYDWFILRSSQILGINAHDISWEEWSKKADPRNLESFATLFDEQLNYKKQLVAELEQIIAHQGRILVIEYGLNIPDGVVEVETEGFFDEFDLPSIDTWFYNDYSKSNGGILFAWIPVRFVAIADKAIATQFLDILHWFDKPPKWP